MNDVSLAQYDNTKPVPYEQTNPDILQAMVTASGVIKNQDLDRALFHLVLLRASQINGCAACVKMHTKEAKEDGEAQERLERLIVWRHVSDFDAREKAALAWTEALTELDPKEDLGPLRPPARLLQRQGDRRAHRRDRLDQLLEPRADFAALTSKSFLRSSPYSGPAEGRTRVRE